MMVMVMIMMIMMMIMVMMVNNKKTQLIVKEEGAASGYGIGRYNGNDNGSDNDDVPISQILALTKHIHSKLRSRPQSGAKMANLRVGAAKWQICVSAALLGIARNCSELLGIRGPKVPKTVVLGHV